MELDPEDLLHPDVPEMQNEEVGLAEAFSMRAMTFVAIVGLAFLSILLVVTPSTVLAASNAATGNVSHEISKTYTGPSAPSDLRVVQVWDNSVELTWVNSTSPNITGSELWWGLNCSLLNNNQTTGTANTYHVYHLSMATNYCFAVQNLLYHNQSTLMGQPFLNVTTTPGYPGGLSVQQASVNTELDVGWALVPGAIVNTTIWFGPPSCDFTVSRSMGLLTTTVFDNLTPATQYCVGLQFYTSGGASPVSRTGGTTRATNASTGLLPTTSLVATDISQDSVFLHWSLHGVGITNVTVYEGVTCTLSEMSTTRLGPTAENEIVEGLESGTTYCFTVQEWNASGPGPYAHPFLTATTLIPPSNGTAGTVGPLTATEVLSVILGVCAAGIAVIAVVAIRSRKPEVTPHESA